ncbi:hypothetical protein CA13_25720 [Planctomycetes bacterium CA13]|uniref:Uncharacterized protein n=1 Tax=Novipirellula herctigrandis TaxID=2527986 RepID=A0A5C5Z1D5_9BACT|nr:hypothetical protein CA13_25720 [Planctomycetes bacterium CA13]
MRENPDARKSRPKFRDLNSDREWRDNLTPNRRPPSAGITVWSVTVWSVTVWSVTVWSVTVWSVTEKILKTHLHFEPES